MRGAEAIIDAVVSDHPPLHLVLGKPALGLGLKKLEALEKDLDDWKSTTLGGGFS